MKKKKARYQPPVWVFCLLGESDKLAGLAGMLTTQHASHRVTHPHRAQCECPHLPPPPSPVPSSPLCTNTHMLDARIHMFYFFKDPRASLEAYKVFINNSPYTYFPPLPVTHFLVRIIT